MSDTALDPTWVSSAGVTVLVWVAEVKNVTAVSSCCCVILGSIPGALLSIATVAAVLTALLDLSCLLSAMTAGTMVGAGSFGRVFHGTLAEQEVAIKVINHSGQNAKQVRPLHVIADDGVLGCHCIQQAIIPRTSVVDLCPIPTTEAGSAALEYHYSWLPSLAGLGCSTSGSM